jgi:murein endopeptidase
MELMPITRLWRCDEQALGSPNFGRLAHGVQLPEEGDNFFTWDAIMDRSPNRSWRRWGTHHMIDTLLEVLTQYFEEEPFAARVGISDISRPRGGIFDERYGGLGHSSHQNGIDVDIAYPRVDGLELGVSTPAEVDLERAQLLVDLFVKAGARYVFVGPRLPLRGRRGLVQKLHHHDDHMHVRLPCPVRGVRR